MIFAVDCDLQTSYVVSADGRATRADAPGAALAQAGATPEDTVLFEIASPVSFRRGGESSAIMYQLARWALWNTAQAARLSEAMPHLLVCPSNVWTKGHDLKTRHLIAACTQPKKDLREAEAMIWFYRNNPAEWEPLCRYLARLR